MTAKCYDAGLKSSDAVTTPMSAELSWHLCRFAELSVDALYALLRLRDQVFVVEQDSVYGDVDNLDPLAWHVQGLAASGALLAYARVLPPGVKDAQAVCIGRVVVAAAARGLGLGSVCAGSGAGVCRATVARGGHHAVGAMRQAGDVRPTWFCC